MPGLTWEVLKWMFCGRHSVDISSSRSCWLDARFCHRHRRHEWRVLKIKKMLFGSKKTYLRLQKHLSLYKISLRHKVTWTCFTYLSVYYIVFHYMQYMAQPNKITNSTNYIHLKWSVFLYFLLTFLSHSVSLTWWTPSRVSSCGCSGSPPFQTPSRTLCTWCWASRRRSCSERPAGSPADSRRHPRPCRCTCRGPAVPSGDGRWRGGGRATGGRCSTGRTLGTAGTSRRTCVGECVREKLRGPRWWSYTQHTCTLWGCSLWASLVAVIQRFWSSVPLHLLLLSFFWGWESAERNNSSGVRARPVKQFSEFKLGPKYLFYVRRSLCSITFDVFAFLGFVSVHQLNVLIQQHSLHERLTEGRAVTVKTHGNNQTNSKMVWLVRCSIRSLKRPKLGYHGRCGS